MKSSNRANTPEFQRVVKVRSKVYSHIRTRYPQDFPPYTRPEKPRKPNVMSGTRYTTHKKVLELPNRVIAVDLEWHRRSGKLTEIGFTVGTKEQGTVSHNYIIDPIIDDRFDYGISNRGSLRNGVRILLAEMAAADIVVGHSFVNDLRQMAINGCPVTNHFHLFDTQIAAGKNQKSLSHLCEIYGIELGTAHVGGNDARATYELFFAMNNLEMF